MRNTLIAMLPAGLVAVSLAGCGGSGSSTRAAQVEKLSGHYAMIQETGIGPAAATPVYATSDGSPVASRLDELNTLRQQIATAHAQADLSTSQKAVLARMLGEIDMANAYYLGDQAEEAYDHARSGTGDLQRYADRIDALQGVLTVLQGDREVVIDTLQTGQVGGGLEIDGIEQLSRRAEAIQTRLNEATGAYEDYLAEAERQAGLVNEHEQAELDLRSRSRRATGDAKYAALDEAVDEWIKARMADIESEFNRLLAAVQSYNAELNAQDLEKVEDVIGALEQRIAQVRSEIDEAQDKIRAARSNQQAAADTLSADYESADARMDEQVFTRLTNAAAFAGTAAETYAAIAASGEARTAMQQEQLSAMLVQLQLYHQHALAMSGYKSAIDTLAANGEEVLGANLANSLASRSDQLAQQIDAIKAMAEPVQTAASDLAGQLISSAGSGSEVAAQLSEQSELLESLRQGLGALPIQ